MGLVLGLGLAFSVQRSASPALCTARALPPRLPPSRSVYSAAAWVGLGVRVRVRVRVRDRVRAKVQVRVRVRLGLG